MAVSPLDLNKGKTTKPERPGFPRKANGKLLLPAAEFKTLSNLRRAYEALDASSVTDPSVKKLIAESSAVISDLLQTHDDPDADDISSLTTTTAPESGVDLALDRAVDEVLKMGPGATMEDLNKVFDAHYAFHRSTTSAGQERAIMTNVDGESPETFYEHTRVESLHAESIPTPKAGVSVILFDSCATRCFEKDKSNGIPGTFMELIVKPIVRQASTTTNGDGLMLMRYNFVVEDMPKTVVTAIVPPMVVSSFNDALSIATV